MPRIARIVVPDVPHHVTQRGNRQVQVFQTDQDYGLYLDLLSHYARKSDVRIVAYSLMPNHVHLVIFPRHEDSLARLCRDCNGTYASIYNQRYGFTGHLWQGRYYSCALDDAHFWAAVRYVERNPLRAGLVRRAERYPWSSARAHCLGIEDKIVSQQEFPKESPVEDWASWLAGEEDQTKLRRLRIETITGRPAASEVFVSELEARLGRSLGRSRRTDRLAGKPAGGRPRR